MDRALETVALALSMSIAAAAHAELTDATLVGAGLRSRPAYDGADAQKLEPVPVLRYLGEPWFVRSTQGPLEGGVRFELATGLHAGAQLAYEPGRSTSESAFLVSHDVPSIRRGASFGLQLEWDHRFGPMPVTLLMRVRRHARAELGTQADLRLSAGVFHGGPVSAGVFTQAIWANADATRARYAVTPQQSANTGLTTFDANGGWLAASAGLIGSIDMGRDWTVVGSFEGRHLLGDAAHSPLVERRTNRYVTLGIARRF